MEGSDVNDEFFPSGSDQRTAKGDRVYPSSVRPQSARVHLGPADLKKVSRRLSFGSKDLLNDDAAGAGRDEGASLQREHREVDVSSSSGLMEKKSTANFALTVSKSVGEGNRVLCPDARVRFRVQPIPPFRGSLARPDSFAASDSLAGKKRSTKSRDASGGDVGFWGFLVSEVTNSQACRADAVCSSRIQGLYALPYVPVEVEKFLGFALVCCLDTLLFFLTVFPVRVFFALGLFCASLVSRSRLSNIHRIDLMRMVLILCGVFVLSFLDSSKLYHFIKRQTVFKLHIIFNLLELFDKLFTSVGHDILDSLFLRSCATGSPGSHSKLRYSVPFLLHFVLALSCVVMHAYCIFFAAMTLGVAINSGSIVTLLLSSNLIEIKQTVLKKFEVQNLFQIACSDVVERFHQCFYIFVVLLHMLYNLSWDFEVFFRTMFPIDYFTILAIEFFVDWVKHVYVCKNNSHPPSSYRCFTVRIAMDVIQWNQSSPFVDRTTLLNRRLGFSPLVLVCVLCWVIIQVVNGPSATLVVSFFAAFILLFLLKMIFAYAVLKWASWVARNADSRKEAHALLDSVERYSLFGKRIP